MDRGVWQATVHGVTKVGHYLAAKERDFSATFMNRVTIVSVILKDRIALYGQYQRIKIFHH